MNIASEAQARLTKALDLIERGWAQNRFAVITNPDGSTHGIPLMLAVLRSAGGLPVAFCTLGACDAANRFAQEAYRSAGLPAAMTGKQAKQLALVNATVGGCLCLALAERVPEYSTSLYDLQGQLQERLQGLVNGLPGSALYFLPQPSALAEYNDAKGTTKADIVSLFKRAIEVCSKLTINT